MRNKGFLFTVLTFMLLLSLFSLASFFASRELPREIYAKKTRGVFDDVRADVEDIWGLEASVARDGNATVWFRDTVPAEELSSTLAGYEGFIENNYSDKISSNLSLSGLNGTELSIESTGIIYGYSSMNKTSIRVYNASGQNSSVQKYSIVLNSDRYLSNVVDSSTGGDLGVEISGTFANTNYTASLTVSRTGSSSWLFNLTNSNVTVRIGRNSIDGQTRDSSMVMNVSGSAEVDADTGIELLTNESVGVKSSIYLTMIDKITRQDYIWLARG